MSAGVQVDIMTRWMRFGEYQFCQRCGLLLAAKFGNQKDFIWAREVQPFKRSRYIYKSIHIIRFSLVQSLRQILGCNNPRYETAICFCNVILRLFASQ